jgi:hypothetical protein
MFQAAQNIIGREKELRIIVSHINGGKHLHIYGSEGTGKSTILDWIYDNWYEINNLLIPIYCRSSRTLREILLHISGFLLNHFKHLKSIDKYKDTKEIKNLIDIKKLKIRDLKNIIFAYIVKDNFCIILNHLEYVTPKINSFLTALYEKALVITASRQSWEITDYAFKGNLNYCLYLSPKLKITHLLKKDAYLLMEYLYESLHMEIPNKSQLFKDIFHITDGNPKMISEILNKARKQEYTKNRACNLKLIQIDLMMEKFLHG